MAGLLASLLGGCTAETAPRDLRTLERSGLPNDALACPAGHCPDEADFETPAYPGTVEDLLYRVEEVAAEEDRTELVASSDDPPQRVFVQRSRVFGFPDTIWAQAVPLDGQEGATGLILYSHSNVGGWDLGVNKSRLARWLEALRTQ